MIKLGLANDFGFTAGALALIARFLLTSGTSLHVITGGVLSADDLPPEQRNGDTVVATIEDAELRGALEQRMSDPAFRAAFEQEVQQFDERDWQAIAQGGGQQPTLDDVAGEPPPAVLGADAEDASARRRARSSTPMSRSRS